MRPSLFLLTNTNSLPPPTSRLCMLSTHSQILRPVSNTRTRPQTNECRTPLWARIFFNLSKSSRSLLSRAFARSWEFLPSTISFCLFKNHSGILYWVGFCRMVTIRSSSSVVSSPALYIRTTVRVMREPFVEVNISLRNQFKSQRESGFLPSWWRRLSIVVQRLWFWSMQTWSCLFHRHWCWEDGECVGRHSCRALREPWSTFCDVATWFYTQCPKTVTRREQRKGFN